MLKIKERKKGLLLRGLPGVTGRGRTKCTKRQSGNLKRVRKASKLDISIDIDEVEPERMVELYE
jgi:hypothetical protein